MLGLIIRREGHGDDTLVASLGAGQLLFKTGDKTPSADFQRRIFCLAAFKRLAIELAQEVDDQLITRLGGLTLRRVFKTLGRRCDTQHRLINRFIGHRHDQLFKLQTGEVRRGDRRQHFQCHRQRGVLTLLIAFAERDVRLGCRAQLLVSDNLVQSLANGARERLLVQLRPVHLLEQIRRHLARAEARQTHRRRHPHDFAFDLGGNNRSRDRHRIGALQTFVRGFDNLHDN